MWAKTLQMATWTENGSKTFSKNQDRVYKSRQPSK